MIDAVPFVDDDESTDPVVASNGDEIVVRSRRHVPSRIWVAAAASSFADALVALALSMAAYTEYGSTAAAAVPIAAWSLGGLAQAGFVPVARAPLRAARISLILRAVCLLVIVSDVPVVVKLIVFGLAGLLSGVTLRSLGDLVARSVRRRGSLAPFWTMQWVCVGLGFVVAGASGEHYDHEIAFAAGALSCAIASVAISGLRSRPPVAVARHRVAPETRRRIALHVAGVYGAGGVVLGTLVGFVAQELDARPLTVGILASMIAVGWIIGASVAPGGGAVASLVRAMAWLALGGSAIGALVFSELAEQPWVLFAFVGTGIAYASAVPAQLSTLADELSPTRRVDLACLSSVLAALGAIAGGLAAEVFDARLAAAFGLAFAVVMSVRHAVVVPRPIVEQVDDPVTEF